MALYLRKNLSCTDVQLETDHLLGGPFVNGFIAYGKDKKGGKGMNYEIGRQ